MPSITTVPKEILLEVTRVSDLKTAINLLRTCKTFYEVIDLRSFWTDQLRYLYWLFQPHLPLQLEALSIIELRELASTPYRFEQRAIKGELDNLPLLHRKLDIFTYFKDVKIVSGGHWLITLSLEWEAEPNDEPDEPPRAFIRLWCISSPCEENLDCVAQLELPAEFTPFEACLQAGDADLDLLVFVNAYRTEDPITGGYIKVFRIQLGAEFPQFTFLAELETDRYCSGMMPQSGNINVTIYTPGDERVRAFVWNWKTGEKVEASSPERGDTSWFIVVSELLSVIWNSKLRSIEVHWSSTSDRPREVDHHFPGLSDSLPNNPPGSQAIAPITDERRTPNGDTRKIALIHLEQESLQVDVEELGSGRVSFTRYAKDNTYMQVPDDPTNPFGNDKETSWDWVRTVNGYLVDMAPSGRFTAYFTTPSDLWVQTKMGQSTSWWPFHSDSETTLPFICPFSGVVGHVSAEGDFYIWRMASGSG